IRARAGQYIPAGRYMPIAEQDNTDRDIDNLLLLHCLNTLRNSAHVENAAPFFLNIKSSLLHDHKFMEVFLAFMAKNRDLAPRMIFEIRQSDYESMPTKLLEVMRALGRLGCSFSLDHVQDLNINIADLQHFKVRFIKIEAAKLLNATSGSAFATMHKNKRKIEANGIGVIVEKIETEDQIRDLLDFDLHYGQGFLFGKPELEGAYKKRIRARRKGWQETVA
ncbi:MAG: EAL domain-containing protein, partial [Alphaproteobacteria bacterium]|nr:EAL domain-containing protein [Alphaproteobacteria bacterium]